MIIYNKGENNNFLNKIRREGGWRVPNSFFFFFFFKLDLKWANAHLTHYLAPPLSLARISMKDSRSAFLKIKLDYA